MYVYHIQLWFCLSIDLFAERVTCALQQAKIARLLNYQICHSGSPSTL